MPASGHILISAIILLPLAGAAAAGLARRRPGLAAACAAAALGLSAAAAAALVPAALAAPAALSLPWAAPLGPDLHLRADALGAIMAMLIGGIGAAVAVYARSYLHGDPGLARLLPTLLAFAAAMQLLVLADDIWLLFVAWELTSACSYLLVLHTRDAAARRAATTALLVTGGGGLALLAGLLLTEAATGATRLSELAAAREALHASALAAPALLLVVLGCATKSALFPFHFWLPGAMAAPTPVSTYLHAATMVKAGIVLLARVHPGFGGTALWEAAVGGIGAATIAAACLRLPGADDLKQLLAWSTVLALGTLATLLSLDSPAAALAAVVLIAAHAAYKGTLFLAVGSIDHGAGTRSAARLGGLARAMPWTAAAAALGAGSMMGLPPFAGFVAKEQVKLAAAGWLPSAALGIAAVALVAVAWWTGVRPFWRRGGDPGLHPHESGPGMLIPLLALAGAGLGLGLGAPWLAALAERAAADIAGAAVTPGLTPLPGAPGKLAAAAAVLGAGVVLAMQRERLARWTQRLPRDLCARAWDAAVHGLVDAGRACVHVCQHGDLRGYLAVVLLAAAALAAPGLLALAAPAAADVPVPGWAWPLAALLAVGAIAAAAARARLAAVAGLGAVGYGMALLFVGLGAPDLALTQVLVETLTVVLMVLAFRHLPDLRPSPAPRWRRLASAAAAGAAGIAATGLVLAAGATQIGAPIGHDLIPAAWERGHGANAVNVILVDIRALDTLGEIAVLLLAAVGVVALVRTGRSELLVARSPILIGASRALLPVAAALAAFLWWRGHHHPGGGFAAGLCLAAALVLVAAARGPLAARRTLRGPPLAWAAAGLAMALGAGLIGVATGAGFLAPHWLGGVGSPLLFDLGVMVLVAGVGMVAVERLLEAEETAP